MSKISNQNLCDSNSVMTVAVVPLAAILSCVLVMPSMAAPAQLTAAQILEKNEAARGGRAAWRAVKALAVTGKMDLGTTSPPTAKDIEVAHRGSPTVRKSLADAGLRKGAAVAGTSAGAVKGDAPAAQPIILPFAMDMKRPHKTRVELVYNKQTAVQTFDGTNGWKFRPFLGQKQAVPLNPIELEAAKAQADLDGMLIDSAAKGTKVVFEKIESLEGHDQYRLGVTLKNGEKRQVWVDAETFLETRVDNKPTKLEGKMRSVSTYYRDYRTVNNVKIPYVVESRVDGIANSGRILVDAVQLNPTLDDKLFSRPL